VARSPGPMRAFFERIRARRGQQIAATAATARKLCELLWHMLTRGEDYAFQRPSMTRHKIRQLELAAGAPRQKRKAGIAGGKSKQVWDAERELSRQAEAACRRLVSDWQATGPLTLGAGATLGRASQRSSKDKAARQTP
jgi:transposase